MSDESLYLTCPACGASYDVMEHQPGLCPKCGHVDRRLVSDHELLGLAMRDLVFALREAFAEPFRWLWRRWQGR